MRAFASVPPTVWQTDLRRLRGDADAIAVYFHLLTSPHSTMIGIYPLNLGYLSLDLGCPLEGASKGLRRVCDEGLATYDEASEIVWVHDMAISQISPRLAPRDNKVSAIAKQLEMLPICPITLMFYARFRELYHLKDQPILEEYERAFRSPFEAPSEPLRSKEKEQEKEKDPGKGKGSMGSGGERLMYPREDDQSEEPFPAPKSLAEGKAFLIRMKVPAGHMEDALGRLLRGCLFPCDIEDFQSDERARA